MTTRDPSVVRKSGRRKATQVAGPDAESERVAEKAAKDADRDAEVAKNEMAQAAGGGLVGKLVGTGSNARTNAAAVLIGTVLIFGGIALLTTDDETTRRKVLDLYQFVTGAVLGYFIRGRAG